MLCCPVYVKRLKTEKLELRSEKGRFVGYPKDCLGYYIYLLADPRVVIARHVIFLEEEFIQEGGIGKKINLQEKMPSCSQVPDQITEQSEPNYINPQIPRRSDRVSHPSDR